MLAVPNDPQKSNDWSCKSSSVTLVDTGVSIYPIHIDYEQEWWQPTPLSEANTHDELQTFFVKFRNDIKGFKITFVQNNENSKF